MMERLRKEWKSNAKEVAAIQQRLWDRVAKDYAERPLPHWEDDAFLQHLFDHQRLSCQHRVLDIGCGSGAYSLALAPKVGEVVGVDISPRMIAQATDRAQASGLKNVRFQCLDWAQADVEALGFRSAFDVVFAHMTPAVNDYETFEKMNACAKDLCLMEKPTRRHRSVLDAVFHLVGIHRSEEAFYGGIEKAFAYLWYQGACPQLYYRDEVWESRKSVEEMVAWCTDRAQLQRPLTEEEQEKIRRDVESRAVDGWVEEQTMTTRVTMVWHVKKNARRS